MHSNRPHHHQHVAGEGDERVVRRRGAGGDREAAALVEPDGRLVLLEDRQAELRQTARRGLLDVFGP